MRGLLLLPLLLLTSCASADIVVKSNVGEKTIIKRETILPHDKGVDEDFLNFRIENSKSLIKTYQDVKGFDSEIENLKREIEATKFEIELGEWHKQFKYTPIYEDLNGKKTVGEEKFTQCVDPDLTASEREKLSAYSLNEIILSKGKGSKVVDEIQRRICAEFAVWTK